MGRCFSVLLFLLAASCSIPGNDTSGSATLFVKMSSDDTGIDFENTLVDKPGFDIFRYHNYYNGGGVAIGDLNNDGLADIYLTSNMGDNKLFLNKGGWKFEDITERAGAAGTRLWSTGVSLADVNADGWLDIYVCNAGDIKGDRANELFINNRDLTFTDKAREYGLADAGFSTHAAFFDYDSDGDLDCYLLNNSPKPASSLGYRNFRHERDESGGHKLYRNDNRHFVDVSEQAGIYGSVIGYGLGVTVGDLNGDHWPDLYVSNDFYERDYLYINNRNGTFTESLENYLGHISMFSMGADLADLDNDGYPEIFSTDMLPEDDYRLKTLTAFETYDVYQLRLKNGYYHQYMRNMLHVNNQDGTFSEIGEQAGVAATDWSWGALMADFDNDRYKEIFVCNGIYRDVTNQDFVEFIGGGEHLRGAIEGKINFREFAEKMPSVRLSNYMYMRTEDWKYKNVSSEWGLDEPGFSNGAAFGDLDNDGDLDLVVNNVNQEAFVYRNNSRERGHHHSLSLKLAGTGENTFGLGASVRLYIGDEIIAQENMPIRGFQSSMDYKMTLGLGNSSIVDSLLVIWPDGREQRLQSVASDQLLVLHHTNSVLPAQNTRRSTAAPLFSEIPVPEILHRENEFNDFDRDRLLYHMMSTQGPAFCKADLNHDGSDDFYLGGSMGGTGTIYLQSRSAPFTSKDIQKELTADETDAVFFDMDGDHDLDLYVVTGGSEYPAQAVHLADRLYENKGIRNGFPEFVLTQGRLPQLYESGSCVRPADVDNDGDLDLFIGTRVVPSMYGQPCNQYLLLNDGTGNFKDATSSLAPGLRQLGMVTDAQWFDYDHNSFPDLLLAGEWMPVMVFRNDGRQLVRVDSVPGLYRSEGWWNRIVRADIDHDGDADFVLGNLGLNSKFKPTFESPLTLYLNDFDRNGSVEPVFAFSENDRHKPFALRSDLIRQMTSLKKQFVYSKDYAGKTVEEIFGPELLEKSTRLNFYQPQTSVLINQGNSGFELRALPWQAQVAPVYGLAIEDVNNDQHPDIILGGNLFAVKPEAGRYDALHGLVLLGDGTGKFKPLNSLQSGIKVQGEVRHVDFLKTENKKMMALIRNNDFMKFYRKTE